MHKELIQEFYNSIEPRFEIILNRTDIEGNKNSIFWKINVKTFSDNFEQFAKKEIRVNNYEIMNFVNLIKLVNAKTIKLHILIFTYFKNEQPAHLKTQIDIKYQELIDYLEHLKGLKLDIINLSRNDFKLANEVKKIFNQGIAELRHFFKSQFIKLECSPLNNNFDQIIIGFKEAIDIQDITLEAELNRLDKKPIIEEEPIDLSDSSVKEKIICLHELGIIETLRSKSTFGISTNQLASILSLITGVKIGTVQSYINPIVNPSVNQKNNPLKNENKVRELRMKLKELGIETNSTE